MYYRLIGACPLLWLLATFSLTLSLASWALYRHGVPSSFEDPLVGFEVRDTGLARRLNAWRLLNEATAWGGLLSMYPSATGYQPEAADPQTELLEKLPQSNHKTLSNDDHNKAVVTAATEPISITTTQKTSSLPNSAFLVANQSLPDFNSLNATNKQHKAGKNRSRNGQKRRKAGGKKGGGKRRSTTTESPSTLPNKRPTTENFTNNNNNEDVDSDGEATVNSDLKLSDPFHSKSHGPSESFFCGKLLEDYAQFVVEPVDKKPNQNTKEKDYNVKSQTIKEHGHGLLEMQSIRDLCTLDSVALRLEQTSPMERVYNSTNSNHSTNSNQFHFSQYCETTGSQGSCCRSWSVANYILLLAGKTDCNAITESDVTAFVQLLRICAPFYADNYLSEDCGIINSGNSERSTACPNVPENCTSHENLAFTVLHYLVDYRFLNINELKASSQLNNTASQSHLLLSNSTTQPDLNFFFYLASTSIFLPMAKSSKLLAYYRAVTTLELTLSPKQNLSTNIVNPTLSPPSSYQAEAEVTISHLQAGSVHVVAADLGCKESLFSEALVSDLSLLILSSTIIFGSLLAYTRSALLTLTALLTNLASLGTAYFLYSIVLKITFFPFLNLLSLIILVAIGSDNALIYCKAWSCVASSLKLSDKTASFGSLKLKRRSSLSGGESSALRPEAAHQRKQLSTALAHVFTSTLCASLTTCAAFFAGYFTAITSLRCFALFAGVAIACNFVITVITFPASIILTERWWCCLGGNKANKNTNTRVTIFGSKRAKRSSEDRRSTADACSTFFFQKVILRLVFNCRHLLAISFILVAVASSLLVFWYPGLQLPATADFQVFSSAHLFERYDLQYQHQFWFSRFERGQSSSHPVSEASNSPNSPVSSQPAINSAVLPIRIVFGILPADNGDHLDPFRRGQLTFDPAFNLSSRTSQEWLLDLCRDLRAQPFFRPTLGPLLTNCFIETFKEWMEERRCIEELDYSSPTNFTEKSDRYPCCQSSVFPYEPEVFDRCLVEVIDRLHRTPSYLFSLNGRAGPRFEALKPDTLQNSSTSHSRELPQSKVPPFGPPQVKAVVIEYDSVFDAFTTGRSFEEMATFWTSVDNWLSSKLATAPEGLRTGWFVTVNSEFFALQSALSSGVHRSLLISVGLAFGTLVLTTWSLRLSLISTISIACTIFTTIGALVVLDWRLNVIESITISLTIGLAIDATLHYTIVYKMLAKGNNHLLGIQMTLARVGSPVAMGAVTTFLAGSVMLLSSILAYIQIGTFLMVLSVVSWLYSTLFHLTLLSIFGAPAAHQANDEGRCSLLSKLKRLLCTKVFVSSNSGNSGNSGDNVDTASQSTSPAETEFSTWQPTSQPPSSGESFDLACNDQFITEQHNGSTNNNNELYTTSSSFSSSSKPKTSPQSAFLRVTSI